MQELQSQAQQLAASGDSAGAQAKASEIEQYTNDAKNVDPKTLVKTKKVTTGKTLTIGAIVSNSVYRDFAIVNDDLAEQIGNKQKHLGYMKMKIIQTINYGRLEENNQEILHNRRVRS